MPRPPLVYFGEIYPQGVLASKHSGNRNLNQKIRDYILYILYTDLSGDAMCRRMLSRNNLAPWQGLANEKTTSIKSFEHMEREKTQLYQSKIIETIPKACKYHSKCESTQNALDTKPWKGCRNNNLAAEKVKITGVRAA